jgi:hypothetical protein
MSPCSEKLPKNIPKKLSDSGMVKFTFVISIITYIYNFRVQDMEPTFQQNHKTSDTKKLVNTGFSDEQVKIHLFFDQA